MVIVSVFSPEVGLDRGRAVGQSEVFDEALHGGTVQGANMAVSASMTRGVKLRMNPGARATIPGPTVGVR